MEIVLATGNRGKVAEIKQILADLPVTLVTKDELGQWLEVEETGESFIENARIKARAFLELTGKPVLAEDSGLEVDVLGGAPGVRSARFAGENATDDENNRKLIANLGDVPPPARTARYRCVAVLVMPDGTEVTGSGVCEGTIGLEPRGSGGFGYDPWFIPAGSDLTMAELPPEQKNVISHRGAALRELRERLSGVLPGI